MKALKERIIKDGCVTGNNILRVDSFLNHQIDIVFYNEIGKEFYRLFQTAGVNKILTIEASGIGIACITAQYFNVPVVFAKKAKSENIADEFYTSRVESFTYKRPYDIIVSKKYLHKEDKILILDDFLANGQAMLGLLDVIRQAGAQLAGAGVVIEKGFQNGGKTLRGMGVNLHSLAIVKSMSEKGIVFED
ncbi:MAG: xanthine phosphoribosyltransferase [Clostridia bacterium]|nr:xanthine phosphoribosyltransferase [Clostridia bacterium]